MKRIMVLVMALLMAAIGTAGCTIEETYSTYDVDPLSLQDDWTGKRIDDPELDGWEKEPSMPGVYYKPYSPTLAEGFETRLGLEMKDGVCDSISYVMTPEPEYTGKANENIIKGMLDSCMDRFGEPVRVMKGNKGTDSWTTISFAELTQMDWESLRLDNIDGTVYIGVFWQYEREIYLFQVLYEKGDCALMVRFAASSGSKE